MKQCSVCLESKPLEEFHRNNNNRTDGRAGKCKPCSAIYNKEWQARNPEKARESWKKAELKSRNPLRDRARKYGLTRAELVAMIESAEGKCQICDRETERLAVDHCHNSRKVRGLLCLQCNTALGSFEDDLERMQKAVEYVKLHKGV